MSRRDDRAFLPWRFFAAVLSAVFLTVGPVVTCWAVQRGIHWKLPPGTAIPVEFTRTVDAGRAKPGDPVTARTMQVVHLGQEHDLTKGSLVMGHVIIARSVHRGVSSSILAFKFDRIVVREGALAVPFYVRALANTIDSVNAGQPTPPAEVNFSQTRTLIDGDQVTPSVRNIYTSEGHDGDVIGENLKDGVFERLRPAFAVNEDSQLICDGTATEQSVAIYSGSACGLYGFRASYLAHTGKRNHGIVEIDSKYFTIELHSQSTALLQVAPDADASEP